MFEPWCLRCLMWLFFVGSVLRRFETPDHFDWYTIGSFLQAIIYLYRRTQSPWHNAVEMAHSESLPATVASLQKVVADQQCFCRYEKFVVKSHLSENLQIELWGKHGRDLADFFAGLMTRVAIWGWQSVAKSHDNICELFTTTTPPRFIRGWTVPYCEGHWFALNFKELGFLRNPRTMTPNSPVGPLHEV